MEIKKALTFRASSIGDSLMGKYFIENIRAEYPEARCALAVSSRTGMIRDLFAAYPWIEVIEVNKNPRALARVFLSGHNDVVVTPYTGGVFPIAPKIVARLIARNLVGYTDLSKLNRFLYTKLIHFVGRMRAPRLLETDALKSLDISISIEHPTFKYIPQPNLLERLGLHTKNYVVLHLFSGSNARGLSPAGKHRLISALSKTLTVPLVLTGTPKETASLGELPHTARVAHTNLQELAHLIDNSAGMVSLDTGAAHIAAHMRKPLIVLASCVGVQWWSPDMYGFDKLTAGGTHIPNVLFTRLDVCTG